jgi:hypothetical protein
MEAGDNKTLFCNVSDDKILAARPRLNSYFDFLLLRWPRSPDLTGLAAGFFRACGLLQDGDRV